MYDVNNPPSFQATNGGEQVEPYGVVPYFLVLAVLALTFTINVNINSTSTTVNIATTI